MTDHPSYYLGAVFDDHQQAEAAVRELEDLGVSEEHLGIIVREPQEHDGLGPALDTEAVQAVEKGMVVGIPVGVLAGMAIVAIAIPGGIVGLGGALAAGAAGGFAAGAYFGGALGLAGDRGVSEEEALEDIALGPGQVLVAVHAAAGHGRAREVLERRGGRIIGS